MTKRKIKIGILGHGDVNVYFSNGLHQNSWLLAKLLSKSPLLDVTYYSQKEQLKADNIYGIKVKAYGDGVAAEDVLFCTSYYPGESDLSALKKNNTKIVITHYGNHLYYHLEDFVNYDSKTRRRAGFWPRKYKRECQADLVLYSPHFHDQRQYFAFSEDLPIEKVQECPYIWSPQFLIKSIMGSDKKMNEFCFSKDRTGNKTVVMMESNLSFTKTNFIPILITENLYNENPKAFNQAWAFGMSKIRTKEEAKNLRARLNKLKIVNERKISFEGRYKLPFILTKGNVLLSHQVLNSLNYIYLEFAYFRLPFVHNSNMLGDAGYYYEKSNVLDGTSQLNKALNHEELSAMEIKAYNESCKELLWEHSIENEKNLLGYLRLINLII